MSGVQASTIDLSRTARHALEEIFTRGYRGPTGVDGSQAPRPHSLITFNIPAKCIPKNGETFYDIFSGISISNQTLSIYTKLLGMFSLAVTRPRGGFGIQASPGVDKRGTVIGNGDQLVFEHNGHQYDRTVQCIEELVTEGGTSVGCRLWIFVIDPEMNMGKLLQDIADSNRVIYETVVRNQPPGVIESSFYIHHAKVSSNATIYDLFASFLADGNNSFSSSVVQNLRQRNHFRALEGVVSAMAGGDVRNDYSITDKDSEAHPTAIFSPLAAFSFNMNNVCAVQRDINNYFKLPADDVRVLDRYEDDDDDNNHRPEVNGMNLADEELMAIQNDMRQNLPARRNNDEDEDTDDNAMRPRRAIDFMQFPLPQRIQQIPIDLFGRNLLNVPMLHTYAFRGPNDGSVDVASIPLQVIYDRLAMDVPMDAALSARERQAILRLLHENHVSGQFEEAAEAYFVFDEFANFESRDTCLDILRRIYQCYIIQQDRAEIGNQRREIRRKLITSKRVLFHAESVINFDDNNHHRDLPVPLPELVSEEGVTILELQHFAKTHDILKLRLENHAITNRISADHISGSDEYAQALAVFREEGCDKFWQVFKESENLPDPLKKSRAFYMKEPIANQWPEHYTICKDLSSYANFNLRLLSMYNEIFRGASTQTIFLILYTIAMNTSMYHFGLRANALLTGDGGTGKSYPMMACEVLMTPGLFKSYNHITKKSFSTERTFADETFCMHEASRDLIGVDDRGFDTSGDPIFKDRLTRQRATTISFGTDESGKRITAESEVMIMVNLILATNDAVPDESKALMQRFINIPVYSTKREGFNKGDQSHINSSEVNQRINSKHRLMAQMFGFLCMIVEKMIMAWIIPEPSMDCANHFMREILQIYKDKTGIDVSDPRKRTMVTHLMRTGAIMNAVHNALCSPLSWNIRHEIGADGVQLMRPFHPRLIVEHVMPRLYVTDEIVVMYMTMCSFMWEPRNQFGILDIMTNMNGRPQEKDKILTHKTTTFRGVRNPNYKRNQARASFGVVGQNLLADEEPEFKIDTGYVSFSASSLTLAYNKISQTATASGARPSVTEVRRVMGAMTKTFRPLHATRIVAVAEEHDEVPVASSVLDPDDDESGRDLFFDDDDEPSGSTFRIRRLSGGTTATVGSMRSSAPARLSQEELYKKKRFRWECDMQHTIQNGAPVVIIESDPTTQTKQIIVSVMIEALLDNAFDNGILQAIRIFMSKTNVPAEGRNLLTCTDYEHVHADGRTETMPQYKSVLRLKRTNDPMIIRHMTIGTKESNAFMNSTIFYNPADQNPSQIIIQNTLGTQLNEPANAHYARMHWRNCGLPQNDKWFNYLPETDSRRILQLQESLSAEQSQSIHYIENYPTESAIDDICKRDITRFALINPNSDITKSYYVKDSDFHRRTSLAEATKNLTFCHFDYQEGTITVEAGATEDQLKQVTEIIGRSNAFSSDYDSIRSVVTEDNVRVQQYSLSRHAVQSSKKTRSYAGSFMKSLEKISSSIASLTQQEQQESHRVASPRHLETTEKSSSVSLKRKRDEVNTPSPHPTKKFAHSPASWGVQQKKTTTTPISTRKH